MLYPIKLCQNRGGCQAVDGEPAGEEQGVLEARRQLSRARGLDPLAQLRRRWRAGVCGMHAGAFSRNASVHSHQAKLTRETMKGSIVYHGVEGLRTDVRTVPYKKSQKSVSWYINYNPKP